KLGSLDTELPINAESNGLERPARGGNSPVGEWHSAVRCILSTAEHEEFRRNPGGASPAAKYSLVTDSEPVPRGKGEKHPGRGVKQKLKPWADKYSEPAPGGWRTFCRMNLRLVVT